MNVQELMQHIAELTDEAIDEEIASLQKQLAFLKSLKKRLPSGGGTGTKRVSSGEPRYVEPTLARITTIIEATGQATDKSLHSQMPDCHWRAVIRCAEEGVQKGVLRKSAKGIYTLAK